MPSRRLSPDTALMISLQAGARRRLEDGISVDVVIDELRREAGGRDDLLAEAAGSLLGGFLAAPEISPPRVILAAASLVAAGADRARVVERAEKVRELHSAPTHTT